MKLVEDTARTPAHCASCFGQKPDMIHVDFDAAFDGPAFADGGVANGDTGRVDTTIDDMVVCLECVEQAAKLVGLVRNDELAAELEQTQAELGNLRERLAGYGDYAKKLEETVGAKNDLLAGARS